jgi:HSP20 family molecular chaperone IbpA
MPRRQMEEWADFFIREFEGVSGPFSVARQIGWTPRVDVMEAADFVLVRAELAGVPASALQVHFRPGAHSLVIKGRRAEQLLSAEEACQAHQLEVEYGQFSREIELPSEAALDISRARTVFRQGMLHVVLPKLDENGGAVVIEGTIRLERLF